VRGRDLRCSFLGKKLSFSQVACKGHVKNSCMLLALFTPNSALHNGECFFFQWCHPIPENKNKEYVRNTQFSSTIYLPALAALLTVHYTVHQNTNSRFSILKKYSPKSMCPQRTSLLQVAKFIVKNCNSPLRCHQTPVNIV
jgi:hypothetical protein